MCDLRASKISTHLLSVLLFGRYQTFDDYDELIVQFGYVSLFIVAFPLTPLLAFASNYFEIWLDSHKLCQHSRRPEPRGADSIGELFETVLDDAVFENHVEWQNVNLSGVQV